MANEDQVQQLAEKVRDLETALRALREDHDLLESRVTTVELNEYDVDQLKQRVDDLENAG